MSKPLQAGPQRSTEQMGSKVVWCSRGSAFTNIFSAALREPHLGVPPTV